MGVRSSRGDSHQENVTPAALTRFRATHRRRTQGYLRGGHVRGTGLAHPAPGKERRSWRRIRSRHSENVRPRRRRALLPSVPEVPVRGRTQGDTCRKTDDGPCCPPPVGISDEPIPSDPPRPCPSRNQRKFAALGSTGCFSSNRLCAPRENPPPKQNSKPGGVLVEFGEMWECRPSQCSGWSSHELFAMHPD